MPDYSNPSKRERKKLRNQIRTASEAVLPSKKRRLLEEVALSPYAIDDGERRFTIGHQYYRDDLCTVKSMKISYLRKVFEGYKNMSRCITEPEETNKIGFEDVIKEDWLTKSMDEINDFCGAFTIHTATTLEGKKVIKQKIPFGGTEYFDLLHKRA